LCERRVCDEPDAPGEEAPEARHFRGGPPEQAANRRLRRVVQAARTTRERVRQLGAEARRLLRERAPQLGAGKNLAQGLAERGALRSTQGELLRELAVDCVVQNP